jgi:ribosomal protein S18 acetylase RimI-like enzyme
VTRLVLEVLRQNESAIKAYRKAGFEVVREFDCYRRDLGGAESTSSVTDSFEVVILGREALAEFAESLDWAPSWENSFAAIDRVLEDVAMLGATYEGKAVGLLVYHPGLSWIMSWVVLRPYRRRGVGTLLAQRLIERLPERVAGVKVLNVLSTDRGMAAFLCRLGFQVYASQFEMELAL